MIFKLSNLHKFFFTYICPTFYGGPPAAPSNTTSTVNQNTIPAELMPYALGNLQAAKGQLFQTDANGAITGYQPYKPYSANPNKYVAGFSALQKQAQQGAGKLKMPGQYGVATGMATSAGRGALGAGEAYNQAATDPGSMSQWMSPYMNNVVDYQTQQANRQYDISGAQQMGSASRAGAFGGSRDAIMAAENERNRNQNITGIQATGAQTAWQDARQAQQFGSTLGMQGYSTAIQGAQELGTLGDQRLAAQTGILNTKNQYGAQQQERQQALMNQRIKNFENQQNQPYRAMDVMSGLVRGTPIAQSSTSTNVANPSYAQQIGGLLGTAGSLYGAYKGKANGGIVQAYANGGSVEQGIESKLRDMSPQQLQAYIPTITSQEELDIAKQILAEETAIGYAEGGIMGYAEGDLVEEEPVTEDEILNWEKTYGVPFVPNTKKVSETPMEKTPVKKGILGVLPVETKKGIAYDPILEEQAIGMKSSKENTPTLDNKDMGIISNINETSPRSEEYDNPVYTQNKGIEGLTEREVAKAAEKDRSTPVQSNAYQPSEEVAQTADDGLGAYRATAAKTPAQIMQERQAEMEKAGIKSSEQVSTEQRKEIMDEKANAKDESKRQMYLRMAEFFSNWGSTPGLPLVAGLKAMKETLPGVMTDSKEDHAVMHTINKSLRDLEHATELEKAGQFEKAYEVKEQASAAILKHKEHVIDLGARREELNIEQAGAKERAQIAAGASMYGADERASVARSATNNTGKNYNASPDIASLRDIRDDLKDIDVKIEGLSGSTSPEDVADLKELKATKKELLDEKVRLKNRMDSRGTSDQAPTQSSTRTNKNLSTMSQEERFAQQSKLGK